MTRLIFKDDIDPRKDAMHCVSTDKTAGYDATAEHSNSPSKTRQMNTDVDMTYRFTWDEEPTDEQLAVIMQKVGEKARRESEELSRKLHKKLEYEYQKAKERYAQL
jgi:hypothetical protein